MRIKRLFLSLVLGVFAFLGTGYVVLAHSSAIDLNQEVCSGTGDNRPDICTDLAPTDTNVNPIYGPDGIITRAVNALSLVVGVVAIIIIIIAGVKTTLSSGDAGKIKGARDQIIYASVGLIVAVLAQAIVRFVLNRIGA